MTENDHMRKKVIQWLVVIVLTLLVSNLALSIELISHHT